MNIQNQIPSQLIVSQPYVDSNMTQTLFSGVFAKD